MSGQNGLNLLVSYKPPSLWVLVRGPLVVYWQCGVGGLFGVVWCGVVWCFGLHETDLVVVACWCFEHHEKICYSCVLVGLRSPHYGCRILYNPDHGLG